MVLRRKIGRQCRLKSRPVCRARISLPLPFQSGYSTTRIPRVRMFAILVGAYLSTDSAADFLPCLAISAKLTGFDLRPEPTHLIARSQCLGLCHGYHIV
jgi:hypothetical protein